MVNAGLADTVGFIGSMASVSGYSLRYVTTFARDRRRAAFVIQVAAEYLAVLDRHDDGMIGMWTLEKWDYTYERHTGRYVTGNLAVLYPRRQDGAWQCRMFLRYQRFHTGYPLLSASGYLAHQLGYCVTGLYDVVITRKNDRPMEGHSSMRAALPARTLLDQGEFKQLLLEDGCLTGSFVNEGTTGVAQFTFHMRRRWADVATSAGVSDDL